jgi:hypothetical protein
MAEPKVFFVHLRRPRTAKVDPTERRDDPFYELGSFGCTGCHSATLFHPRHAGDLEGARLAFIQGGPLGHRLVFLTPPIVVRRWPDHCEARWTPVEMPFRYTEAPILAYNDGPGDFPLLEHFARRSDRTTVEGGLSSRLRSRSRPLSVELAKEVIRVYEQQRAEAPPSAIASTYEQALPYDPPRIDRNREATYRRRIRELTRAEAPPAETHARSRCARRPRTKTVESRSEVEVSRTLRSTARRVAGAGPRCETALACPVRVQRFVRP